VPKISKGKAGMVAKPLHTSTGLIRIIRFSCPSPLAVVAAGLQNVLAEPLPLKVVVGAAILSDFH
jgi:hypothetical protein